jgi:hypothetical protein
MRPVPRPRKLRSESASPRAHLGRDRLLAWVRLALGGGCVATAVVVAAVYVPRTVQGFDDSVRADAYITSAEERVITSGDSLGIPFELQVEAIRLIPRRSSYAVLLPATPQLAADRYGISLLTYQVTPPWFEYLLLPAEPVGEATRARYVLCWGCDRPTWDRRTTWLWDNRHGEAIGRVRG